MNVEFKTHQLVVAGMDTQIKLLTARCVEWQQKLAEAKASATQLAGMLDVAEAKLAGISLIASGCENAPLPSVIENSDAVRVVRGLVATCRDLEHTLAIQQEAAASKAEKRGAKKRNRK